MTTALTVYPSNVAATTLTHASADSNTTGGSGVGIDDLINMATGYGEFYLLGNVSAWAAAGALGNPSGHGALWDVATLEGQWFAAGTWTAALRGSIHNGNGNITADMYIRVYVYNSLRATYTSIGQLSLTGQSITSTSANYTGFSGSLSECYFNLNDKLYFDIWFNVTANANTATNATLRFNVSNSATAGTTQCELVTPGYSAQIAVSVSDSASGAETEATTANISASDSGSGAESLAISAAISTLDEVPTLTALTLYGSNVVATTLAHAGQLVTGTGGGVDSGIDTLLGTALTWLQWYARGNSSAPTTSGSIGAQDGHGLLLDSILLEECYLADGNWSPILKGTLHNGNGNVTADIVVRASVYHGADGSYTTIGTMTLAGQTILSSGSTLYTFSATELPQTPLGIGDKLYIDIWFNVTANANTATNATLRFNLSSNLNGVTDSQIVTSGYFAIQAQEQVQIIRPPVQDSGVGGEGTDVSGRSPLNAPYNLPGVPLGGPYVVANNGYFAQGGLNLKRLYGFTFYSSTQGGSPAWQSNAEQAIIDDVVSVCVANHFSLLRPTDQWGKVPTLSWDNPQIWTNMDYLIQQAALNGLYVQLDLSGWKNVLTSRGLYAFETQYWTDYLTAVASHYANVNNVLFVTIAGEPTFPNVQSDVDALVSFFTSTIATYKAADPNHLMSPGGFISMNNGLANWWQQIWAISSVDVCCYKTYSQNDLNNAGTYSSYAANTLGKIPCQQEFGIPGWVGDGVATGQSFNGFTGSRSSYYDQVLSAGENNGTRAFIFWNYAYQGTNFVPPDDQPSITDQASGSDGTTADVPQTGAIGILDQAAGGDALTLYGQSYDLNPEAFPATWSTFQQHAWSDAEVVDPGIGTEGLGIAVSAPLAEAGAGLETIGIAASVATPPDSATSGQTIDIAASLGIFDSALGVDIRGAILTISDALVTVCAPADSLVTVCAATDSLAFACVASDELL